MGRFSAGMTAAGAGTNLRPIFGILATAIAKPAIREIAVFNTTNVACTYRVEMVTGGTPGATVTAYDHSMGGNTRTPDCLAKQLWTGDDTARIDTGYYMELGAAQGSSCILAFGGEGLQSTFGATVAIAITPVGTGQVCRVYMVWDE